MEYRISEGRVLRKVGPGKLEAWGPQSKRWFEYSNIDKDWIETSLPLSERKVPAEARSAPSSYAAGDD